MPTPPRAQRIEQIRALAAEGLTDPQIADTLGVCSRTVLRDRVAANIPTGFTPRRTAKHGDPAMWGHRGCSCETCRVARNANHGRYVAAKNQATLTTAHAGGRRWSPAEDAAVLDTTRTIEQIAVSLGRSWFAVNQRRHKLRREAEAAQAESASPTITDTTPLLSRTGSNA